MLQYRFYKCGNLNFHGKIKIINRLILYTCTLEIDYRWEICIIYVKTLWGDWLGWNIWRTKIIKWFKSLREHTYWVHIKNRYTIKKFKTKLWIESMIWIIVMITYKISQIHSKFIHMCILFTHVIRKFYQKIITKHKIQK